MMRVLGRTSARHPILTLLVWLLAAVTLARFAPNWQANAQDDDIRFLPNHLPSVQAHFWMEEAFPRDVFASRAIIPIRRNDQARLDADDMANVLQLVQALEKLQQKLPGITSILRPGDGPVGQRLISNDGKCVLIPIALSTPYLALQTKNNLDQVEKLVQTIPLPGLNWCITGAAGVGRDLVGASAKSLDETTWATVTLVALVLLVVYRSPILALIPLFTIGLAVFVSLQLLAYVSLIPGVRLVPISQIFLIVILFGAGTDYCLFLISRYREELEWGEKPASGLPRASNAVTGAILASAGTIICGLGLMGFAEFGKIRCAGPVIGLGLVVGTLACLTLTPALLALTGRAAFWPIRVFPLSPRQQEQLFWTKASRYVIAHPGKVFAACLAVLLPLSVLGLGIRPSFQPTGDLSASSPSVEGMETIQQHFTAGETGPITLLFASPDAWTLPANRALLQQTAEMLKHLPNVAEVRCLTQPLGVPPVATPPRQETQLTKWVNQLSDAPAIDRYCGQLAGERPYLTRMDIVTKSDPFERESQKTLELLERWHKQYLPLLTGSSDRIETRIFGVTANARDLESVIFYDRLRINGLVTLGVFGILWVIVRRFWLASYLLVTVLLSYLATLGATAAFSHLILGKELGEMEWRVPFFLFTILVAVGEDYNILLITRILQEREQHGLREGIRRGLSATGGTISACGLIMAGTFGTLMLSGLSTLQQIGFALAFGVLLDTFVIRPFLVPAFLLLVWEEAEPIALRRKVWLEKYRPLEERLPWSAGYEPWQNSQAGESRRAA